MNAAFLEKVTDMPTSGIFYASYTRDLGPAWILWEVTWESSTRVKGIRLVTKGDGQYHPEEDDRGEVIPNFVYRKCPWE
jgi:hypothetical protein